MLKIIIDKLTKIIQELTNVIYLSNKMIQNDTT